MLDKQPAQVLESGNHPPESRKSQPIRMACATLIERRLVPHADKEAVIHGSRCEASQRNGSLQMPQPCLSSRLMLDGRRDAGVALAPAHLHYLDG
jgi:hypothetical protein